MFEEIFISCLQTYSNHVSYMFTQCLHGSGSGVGFGSDGAVVVTITAT